MGMAWDCIRSGTRREVTPITIRADGTAQINATSVSNATTLLLERSNVLLVPSGLTSLERTITTGGQ